MDIEKLKNEIWDLKKHLQSVLGENHLLKVKVRKLEFDNVKKNKQIECLLDPRKV